MNQQRISNMETKVYKDVMKFTKGLPRVININHQ